MSWRTVIVANQAKLDYKMGCLVVRGVEMRRVLLDEIAIVVIENPAVSITGCLIEALIEKKIKVIFCDAKRSPTAELIPHHGSHDSAAKIRTQATWPEEKIVRCTVGTLARAGAAAGISKTALVMVGDFLAAQGERSRLYDPSFTTEFREGTK